MLEELKHGKSFGFSSHGYGYAKDEAFSSSEYRSSYSSMDGGHMVQYAKPHVVGHYGSGTRHGGHGASWESHGSGHCTPDRGFAHSGHGHGAGHFGHGRGAGHFRHGYGSEYLGHDHGIGHFGHGYESINYSHGHGTGHLGHGHGTGHLGHGHGTGDLGHGHGGCGNYLNHPSGQYEYHTTSTYAAPAPPSVRVALKYKIGKMLRGDDNRYHGGGSYQRTEWSRKAL